MRTQALLLAMLAALYAAPSLAAREVSGVVLSETARVAPDAPALTLNGAGTYRRYFFFKVYVAALYVMRVEHDPRAILGQAGPKRLALHFLRDVSPDKVRDLWARLGSENDELQRLQARRERFEALFTDGIAEGDRIFLDYIPDEGTHIRINGRTRAVIPGDDFYDALLRLWIGKRPMSTDLKESLLGT